MNTLFVDLASHNPLFALAGETSVIALQPVADHKEEDLMPILEGMLASAKRELSDIGRIACVTGPGGFMSLRVGVAFANALAWGLKVPIAGIHQSDVYAQRIRSRSGDVASPSRNQYVWLHSTKKELLFLRGFGDLAKQWPDPQLITLADAKAQIPAGTAFIGELIPEQRVALGLPEAEVVSIEEILPGLVDGLSYARGQVLPWYGREA